MYGDWFARSPWPDALGAAAALRAAGRKPRLTAARRAFAARLIAFLETRRFADGWRPSDAVE